MPELWLSQARDSRLSSKGIGQPSSPFKTTQLVHALQKNLTASLALFGLVLGFGEGDLVHGRNESYRLDDGRIIADFGGLFRTSLTQCLNHFQFDRV